MRNFLLVFLSGVFVFCGAAALPSTLRAEVREDGVAASVNNEAITVSDVKDRMKLIMASAGLPNQPDVIAKLRPQIVNMLIEERLKKQEAMRFKISAAPEDIETGLSQVAGQNKMTAAQFTKMLSSRGISIRTLKDQIEAQILWMQLVNKKIRPRVNVSDKDVDSEMARIKSKIGTPEWLLSEIVLPTSTKQQDKASSDLAIKIIAQVKAQPASFPGIARQFSQAAGASNGGDMGWLPADNIPEIFSKPIEKAQPGTLLGPARTPAGLHILLIRDKRNMTPETMPKRDAVMNRIGTQRLDRAQRQYLMDLQSSAFIDIRDGGH